MRNLAWLALALAACLDADLTVCADGTTCGSGQACAPTGGCVDPAQLGACVGLDDGATCTLAGVGDGVCRARVCVVGACGDGVLDPGEVCDDGNADSGDGCRGDCRSDELCGNAILDPAELCDLGADNADAPDASCRTTCRPPRCGDGIVDDGTGEACDDGVGNADAPDAGCRPNCQPRRCSDGIIDQLDGEVCDDGNLVPDDGCAFDCGSDETCGNGVVDFFVGEACDDGNRRSYDGCSRACRPDAPPVWTRLDVEPEFISFYPAAWDEARDEAVLFGDDTFTWRDGAWRRRYPVTSPPPRYAHAMAYDPARAQVVLFGGQDASGRRADTWTWDGVAWTAHPGAGPRARSSPALAFHPPTARIVLFGGRGTTGTLADTWTWDGRAWSEAPTPAAPPSREQAAMAPGPGEATLILLGGVGDDGEGGTFAPLDAWAWSGSAWSLLDPDVPCLPRIKPAAAYDRAGDRLVVFAGGYQGLFDDAWSWNGTSWAELALTPRPEPRVGHSLLYAPTARALLSFGAETAGATWPWRLDADATGWSGPSAPLAPPGPFPMVADAARGVIVMSTYSETWERRGGTWRSVGLDGVGGSLAYDVARQRVVGLDDLGLRSWDGASWTLRGPAPIGDSASGIVYDVARDRLITMTIADSGLVTWEWDGTAWTARAPTAGPPLRLDFTLGYDVARARTVLFSGTGNVYDTDAYLADTWEWDGSTWMEVATEAFVPARADAALTYDPDRQRLVLVGGHRAYNGLVDVWEWDGQAWTLQPTVGVSPGLNEAFAAYDPLGHELLVTSYGGGQQLFSLRWEGDLEPACGAGTSPDGDALIGCDDPDCWAVCAPLCPPLTTCDPAAAPSCGDGACGAVEDCRACPTDCACVAACGDGFCDAPEDAAGCPGDCP